MKAKLKGFFQRVRGTHGRGPLKIKNRSEADSHPLAHLAEIYQPRYVSYFTHRGQYRPLALMIETVNICNNDCIICPYSAQTRRKQTMPLWIFDKIVQEYSAMGGGPVGLTPMVGEVFLDKQLQRRLELLKASPAITRVSAITNASMLYRFSDEALARIVPLFDRLTVSVYGLDADEYKLLTQKDQYEKMIEGIVRLLALTGPENLLLSGRHLKARSPEEINAWVNDVALRAGVNPSSVRFAGTLNYANWSFFDVSKSLPHDAKWLPIPTNRRQCALPLVSAQVLSDGTVSFCACADFNANSALVIGNVTSQSLCDILTSEKVRQLWNWDKHGVPEFCRKCSFHMPVEQVVEIPSAMSEPLATFGG